MTRMISINGVDYPVNTEMAIKVEEDYLVQRLVGEAIVGQTQTRFIYFFGGPGMSIVFFPEKEIEVLGLTPLGTDPNQFKSKAKAYQSGQTVGTPLCSCLKDQVVHYGCKCGGC